ncbi:MAG: S8 family serine peptidase [Bacilli bacterium]|nr:S8 family serine peptidase [Bacilli bacterium]
MKKALTYLSLASFGLFLSLSSISPRTNPVLAEEKEEEVSFGGAKAIPFEDRYSSSDIPAEPKYSQAYPLNFEALNVGDKWNNYRGEKDNGDPITVAIIDSGIDIYHEDFLTADAIGKEVNADNIEQYSILDPKSCYIHDTGDGEYTSQVKTDVGIKYAYEKDSETYDGDYETYYSHGTACSSCVAAAINGVGGFGVAPKANILFIKMDFYFTSLDVAIRYAANNGADVISMSLGAYNETFKDGYGDTQSGSSGTNTYLESAIAYAHNKDCVVVAAAGNEKTDHHSYPACNSGVIGVGALSRKGRTSAADFSNFNINGSDNEGDDVNVDVMAPGYVYTANVNESAPAKTSGDLTDNYYYETQGTSFACPLTAGVVALARAAYPELSHSEIERRLFDSCYDMGSSGWDYKYGYGRVDVDKLLTDTPLQSIALSPTETTIAVGETLDLNVEYTPEDASNKLVNFLSDNESVATVDIDSGKITGVAVGDATIEVIPDENGVDSASMVVHVEEGNPFTRVSSVSDLTSGSVVTFVNETSNKVIGQYSASYFPAVDATISNATMASLPSGAEKFVVRKDGNNYTFTLTNGTKLGHSGNNVAFDSNSSWALSIKDNNVTMTSGSTYFSYNSGSPRWKTYAAEQGNFQIYKRGGEVIPTPVVHTLSPISGDSSVEVDSKITLSTSCDQSDTISWSFSGTGTIGFNSGKTSTATGNSVDVYGLTAGSVTVTATCAGESSVSKTITVNEKEEDPPTPVTEDCFSKITSQSQIETGDYLIVYESGLVAFNGALSTLDGANNTVNVAINDNKITHSEALEGSTFHYDSSSNSLKSKSGYYIGRTADSNGMDTSTSEVYTNTLTYSGGDVTIASSGGRSLKFNDANDQNRFRYYGNNATVKAVQLYKLCLTDRPEKVLDSISVSYTGGDLYVGDTLDTSKITVTAHYSDEYYADAVIAIGNCVITGFSSEAVGEVTVTISYTEGSVGKSATFSLNIKEDALNSISATCNKTYEPGESIDKSSISVIGHYASGNKAVTSFDISPETYTFSYADAPSGGSSAAKEFTITYAEKECKVNVGVARKAYAIPSQPSSLELTGDTFENKIGTSTSTATTGEVTISGITYELDSAYTFSKNGKACISFGKSSPGFIKNKTALPHFISSIAVIDENSITPTLEISQDGENYIAYNGGEIDGNYRYFYLHYSVSELSNYSNVSSITIAYKGDETLENVVNYINYEDTANQCLTKLDEAIEKLNACSSSDISSFFSSEDYKVRFARTRLNAWAAYSNRSLSISAGKVVVSAKGERTISFDIKQEAINPAVFLLLGLPLLGVGAILIGKKKKS